VLMLDPATVALITQVLLTLTGIALLVTLWKGSKVVQFRKTFRRSEKDRRTGTDLRQSTK
jgi:hypothetical protein